MDLSDAINSRYSCRAYLDRPVGRDVVQELIALAQRAPSWGNTQPWRAYVAGGQAAVDIRVGLVEAARAGLPETPEVDMPAGFEGRLMDRYRDLGKSLFGVLGIGRGDTEKRAAHYANNFNAFGAPCLLYVTVPAGQTGYVLFDAGAFMTAFCLAAAERGLGTCIIAALARHPQVVRRVLPVGPDELIAMGAALGWPDPAAAVNAFRSRREPAEKVAHLSGL